MRSSYSMIEQFLRNEDNCQELILLLEHIAFENQVCNCVLQTPRKISQSGRLFNNSMPDLIDWVRNKPTCEFTDPYCVLTVIKNETLKSEK